MGTGTVTRPRKRKPAVDPSLRRAADEAWDRYRKSYRGASEPAERKAAFLVAREAELRVMRAEWQLGRLIKAAGER